MTALGHICRFQQCAKVGLDDNTLDLLLVVESDVAPHPDRDQSEDAHAGRSNAHVAHGGAVRCVDGVALGCAPGVAELGGQTGVNGRRLALLSSRKGLREVLGKGVLPDGSGDGVTDSSTDL